MENARLREAARHVAQRYAPMPTDSRLMFAVLGTSVVFVALAAAQGFYSFDAFGHPQIAVPLLVCGALAGLALRMVQSRRHRAAHRAEYVKAAARQ